jgi:hypothetical protein
VVSYLPGIIKLDVLAISDLAHILCWFSLTWMNTLVADLRVWATRIRGQDSLFART